MPIRKEKSKYNLGKTIQPHLWYVVLGVGCLLNIIVITNSNLFFSSFFTLIIDYISTLYPTKANLILSISNFNEIYDLEFIIIFICFFFKYLFLFIFLLSFIKNILYINEYYFFFFSFFFYLFILFLFSYIFFIFFPYLIFNQTSNIFHLILNENLLLSFNLNIPKELNNITIYLTVYIIICKLCIKKTILGLFYVPHFIYIFFFFYFYKYTTNKLYKRKSGIRTHDKP